MYVIVFDTGIQQYHGAPCGKVIQSKKNSARTAENNLSSSHHQPLNHFLEVLCNKAYLGLYFLVISHYDWWRTLYFLEIPLISLILLDGVSSTLPMDFP